MKDVRLAALLTLLSEEGGVKKQLAARIKKSPSQLSQWLSGYRTITEDTAREIEQNARKPPGWMDVPLGSGVDQHLIHQTRTFEPKRLTWEQVVSGDELGQYFQTSIPDDSMSPDYPRGLDVIWSTVKEPKPGSLVLVRDATGALHVREYRQGLAPSAWIAAASNRAFSTLTSQDGGITVIAVAAFKEMP